MSPLRDGERQVAATVAGVREDHVARYSWAADRLAGLRVVDAGCGIGYGSSVLAQRGCNVTAVDADAETIAFAKQHYNHDPRIDYQHGRVEDLAGEAEAVVAFEVLEHLAKPERALVKFRELAPRLLVSVPNEDRFPFEERFVFHKRHYRQHELNEMLTRTGWRVVEWWGQKDHRSPVEPDTDGRTLVAVCERTEGVDVEILAPDIRAEDFALPGRPLPESVAIVAMGGTGRHYVTQAMQAGDRSRFVDEVWAINNAAGVIHHDRVFHMDDLQVQRSRAEANPKGAIAGVMGWLPNHDRPVYTPRSYDWAPASVEYPIEWVLNQTGHCYFNNTVPYAFAFAMALGSVKRIHLFGCDYGYPDDQAFKREKGRACLEYWIAIASDRGIGVAIPEDTTLLDAAEKKYGEKLYGYDTEWVRIDLDPRPSEQGGGYSVSRVERRPEDIPTAQQMEIRYSHDTRYEHLEGKV